MWQWSYGRQFLWPNECKRRSNDILRDAPAEIPAALLDHSTVLASWRQLHKNGLLKFGRVPIFPVTLLPRRVRSIIMNMSVCLSARISQKPHHTIVTELQEIFVRVACGRGSFFSDFIVINYILPYLWMTSSFHTMSYIWYVLYNPGRRERNNRNYCISFNQIFHSDKDQQVGHAHRGGGVEVCHLWLPCSGWSDCELARRHQCNSPGGATQYL